MKLNKRTMPLAPALAYLNDGEECITRVIDPAERDLGIELFAGEGSAMFKRLEIWRMRPIW
ncbi:MAG: GH32 C-terminal domain-containing protein [Planctomycetes bacterium]|nr:GH32 C-terminal domain-containing protein [Planctomycetota bacterium]